MQTDSQQKLNVLNMQSGKTGWLKITATRQKHTVPWGEQTKYIQKKLYSGTVEVLNIIN